MVTSLPNEQVNIGDVLRLALPLKTEVIGGARTTRRSINWATVVTDWSDLAAQVFPNDLVLLPPKLQGKLGKDELVIKFQELADLDAVGVILFEDISEDLRDPGLFSEMSLLIVPPGQTVRDTPGNHGPPG